nr:hypothetical protein [uncultured Duganella sp.]
MTFDTQTIGQHNAPLIGVAPLMRRAFAGEDLSPVGQTLLERAQAYPNDAHAYMDFSTVLQLTGNREDALAVQAEAIMLQPHYTIAARRAPGLSLLVLMGPGDLMANTPVEFLVENSDVTLELLYLRADEDFPDEVPEHDVMLVAVAESEANQVLLQRLMEYTSDWPRPVINRPQQIRMLSRDGVCAALRGVPGVELPVTVRTGLGALMRSPPARCRSKRCCRMAAFRSSSGRWVRMQAPICTGSTRLRRWATTCSRWRGRNFMCHALSTIATRISCSASTGLR